MYGRKYQWIIMGTYGFEWWKSIEPEFNCTLEELEEALEQTILTDLLPLSTSGEITISGITAEEYRMEYDSRRGNEYSRFHGYTYDGIWAVALAIQNVAHKVKYFRRNETVTDFRYRDPMWERLFLDALHNTSFEGVTGPVRFYDNERKASILLKQFQEGQEIKVGEYSAATQHLDLTLGAPLKWIGKHPPKDRTLVIIEHTRVNKTVYAILATLAVCGILMAIVFLGFNIKYRNQRYIKMSSPQLNNLIIIGCMLTYTSIIFLGLDSGLSSIHILLYLDGKSRPVVEGEAVFRANHVILCEAEDFNKRHIFALCLQTSAMKSSPHEVKLKLGSRGTPVEKWMCICSCKAGQSGYCKHVVAVLLYVNCNQELDASSCTDVKQVWGKEKKKVEMLYSAERAVDYWNFQKKTRLEYESNTEVDKTNLKCKPSSTISVFYNNAASKGVQRLYLFHDFLANIEPMQLMLKSCTIFIFFCSFLFFFCCSGSAIPDVQTIKYDQFKKILDTVHLSKFISDEILQIWYPQGLCCRDVLKKLGEDDVLKALMSMQGSEEWKNLRKLRVTGSSIYSLFTYSKTNWEEKAKRLFWPKGFSNKFVEHGKLYEERALEAFSEKHKEFSVLKVGFIIDKNYPWIGYSPDGIILKEGKPFALLEIKCPFIGKTHPHDQELFIKSCDYVLDKKGTFELKEKHNYFGQVQLGMAI